MQFWYLPVLVRIFGYIVIYYLCEIIGRYYIIKKTKIIFLFVFQVPFQLVKIDRQISTFVVISGKAKNWAALAIPVDPRMIGSNRFLSLRPAFLVPATFAITMSYTHTHQYELDLVTIVFKHLIQICNFSPVDSYQKPSFVSK